MGAAAIQLLIQYRYVVIVPITIFEGPIVMLVSGFLLRLGYFSFFELYFALMMGDLIGDVLWYSLGYFGGMPFIARFGKYVSITEAGVNRVQAIFDKYHSAILFVSKITMGFGFALVTLFTAGMTRVPFWKYLIFNIIGGFIWTGFLIAVGYYLGNFYLTVGKSLEVATLIASATIVVLLLYGFGKYIKKTLNV
jgi:membrane-associated protein